MLLLHMPRNWDWWERVGKRKREGIGGGGCVGYVVVEDKLIHSNLLLVAYIRIILKKRTMP